MHGPYSQGAYNLVGETRHIKFKIEYKATGTKCN